MKRLILMRHGDAPHTLYGDGDRVLSEKGALETAITARYIKSNNHIGNYKIGHILCSSAQRNRQTLDILQGIIETGASVEYSDAIYHNDLTILQELVSNITSGAETVLLLGHNPTLLTFALNCDNQGYDEWSDELSQGMNTAEIIVIEFENCNDWHNAMIFGGKIKDIFIPGLHKS